MDGAELWNEDLLLVQVFPLVPLRFLFRHGDFFKFNYFVFFCLKIVPTPQILLDTSVKNSWDSWQNYTVPNSG
jgi:hypothetical protein